MAAGALVGIIGTIIYPRMRRCVGQQRTGLFGLSFQTAFLTLCVASVWAPGSPFDLHFADKNVLLLSVSNSTDPPSYLNTSDQVATNLTSFGAGDKTWEDYISIGLLMTGIIGARCGTSTLSLI